MEKCTVLSISNQQRIGFMNEKTNRKKRIIIIVLGVLVIALAAAGVIVYSFFAPKDVDGSWEMIVNPETSKATVDEADSKDKVYYSFGKTDDYGGKYKTYYQGGVEDGSYKLSEKDGKKYINLGTEDLEYSITGSKLFGGAKLTITYPETTDGQSGTTTPAQDYVFVQAKAPDYENDAYSTFNTDKELLAQWSGERKLTYYTTEIPYTESVRFNENGVMTIHYKSNELLLDRSIYYAYTAQDGELKFSLVTDKENQYTVKYTIDKDGNLQFTEDKTNGSIFAGEFFSNIKYVKAE